MSAPRLQKASAQDQAARFAAQALSATIPATSSDASIPAAASAPGERVGFAAKESFQADGGMLGLQKGGLHRNGRKRRLDYLE